MAPNVDRSLQQPPEGWAIVELSIYRATTITNSHIPFLKLKGCNTVVNLASQSFHGSLVNAIEAAGMGLYQPCVSQANLPAASTDNRSQISDEIVKDVLEFVLEPSFQPLVLTGSRASNGVEVAALVGCLRRVQTWAFTAILLEYRLFAPTSAHNDVNRQFIERFDVSLVHLPDDPPEWLGHQQALLQAELVPPSASEEDRFCYHSRGYVPLASDYVSADQIAMKLKDEDD
jgi:hypothetical protein